MAKLADTTTATGAITLTDGDVGLASMLSVDLTFASTGTVAVQGKVRGAATFRDLLMVPFNSATGVTSTTASGAWRVDATGCEMVQLNITANGSGITYAAAPTQG